VFASATLIFSRYTSYMPVSQDYIKRMIQQFGEFLVALKTMMIEERYDEAREQIDLGYRAALSLDPETVRSMPDDVLILNTAMSRVGDMDKSVVLGDLLTMDGEWHERTGDYDTAQTCYFKAANVLTEALLRQPFGTAKDYVERIDLVTSKLEPYDVPFETRWRLFHYSERVKRFADAEDDLFALLDLSPDDDELIDEGIAFYDRLLKLKDHELILGGLPRDEVQAGLAELKQR